MSPRLFPTLALWRQSGKANGRARAVLGIRFLAASVWIVFGLVFKVLGMVPRHEQIVATVLGDAAASATLLIGILETGLGLWVLSGFHPRACAAVQTIAIAAMNAFELLLARHLLLSPAVMVCANVALLSLVWFAAMDTDKKRE